MLCLLSLLAVAAASGLACAADGAASFADFDRRARAGERLEVVFFGASLTWGANATDQSYTSYRAHIARRLEERYPHAHFHCHDAAIGGTGSQLGVFRLERDVMRRRPDLVFLDFSANDDITTDDADSMASYEAIVRRVVGAGIPLVQVAFPFRWNIARAELPKMKRLDAHRAIAEAYGCGWGDAITLIIERVERGDATLDALWDTDAVHPGDAGYALFAEAAWNALCAAIDDRRICRAPARMLNADTYLTAARVRLDRLGALPAGWRVAKPSLTSVNYDWLMSRWLDALVVADNRHDGTGVVAVAPLALTVRARSIMLFGEATARSGRFRVLVDGRAVTGNHGQAEGDDRYDANPWNGNGHLALPIAADLDPALPHRVEIAPVLRDDAHEELRLESICVAGGDATVELAP